MNGSIWYVIKVGRVGVEGYLDLDGKIVIEKVKVEMNFLDINIDFYIGGVLFLNFVNFMVIVNEFVGF